MAVYTMATLAPAFNTSKACLPLVIPPVAKITFSLLVSSSAGVEREVFFDGLGERTFSAASGAAPRAGSTAENAAFVSAAVVVVAEEVEAEEAEADTDLEAEAERVDS